MAKQITVRRCEGTEWNGNEVQRLRNDRPGLLWHCTDKRSEGKAVTGIDVPGQVGVLIRKGIAWQSEACQGKGKAKRI